MTSTASAGTVTLTVRDDGMSIPNGACNQTSAASPFQFLLKATGAPCDWRLRIDAVPGSRAGDIVGAHAVVRLKGIAGGFRVGLLGESSNAIIGSLAVPAGDHVVTTRDSTGPFQVSSGTLTLDLRSTGAGTVAVGGPATRVVVLRMTDTRPPRVLGPIGAIAGDVAVGRAISAGARLTDNGPTTTGLAAVIHWGDGRSTGVGTPPPLSPFSANALQTGVAHHAYTIPGKYTVSVDVRDSAGNVGHSTLGRLRVWGRPVNARSPRVRGLVTVGSVLSCSTGQWLDTGGPSPFTFRWLRGGAVIAGATLSGYRLTPADRNHLIACRVTGTNPVGTSATADSPGRRLWIQPVLVHRPKIKGRRRAGTRLTCGIGVWRGVPARSRITWIRNRRQLHSHGRRLFLRRADRGARISCRVTVSNPAGQATASSRTIRVRR